VLVTHEPDIAEFASRVVTVRDGLILSDERHAAKDARRALENLMAEKNKGEIRVNPFITLKIALRALMRNTMRSFLTTLGISLVWRP